MSRFLHGPVPEPDALARQARRLEAEVGRLRRELAAALLLAATALGVAVAAVLTAI